MKGAPPRMLGKLPLFGQKKMHVFSQTEHLIRPMQVAGFYPNRGWAGSFKDVVRGHPRQAMLHWQS